MYKLKKRAERRDETRRRIVEATVHLHEARGASKTSISAIAELAGVERLTVYRHFPDQRALLTACTSHYLKLNPPPDPNSWRSIADAGERLRLGLTEIFAYHRRTEPMFVQASRDIEGNPLLREVLSFFFAQWDHAREILASAWETPDSLKTPVRAFIGHAMSFQTWRSLVREQGLDDAHAVGILVRAAKCIGSR